MEVRFSLVPAQHLKWLCTLRASLDRAQHLKWPFTMDAPLGHLSAHARSIRNG